jgi:hypothetical protein
MLPPASAGDVGRPHCPSGSGDRAADCAKLRPSIVSCGSAAFHPHPSYAISDTAPVVGSEAYTDPVVGSDQYTSPVVGSDANVTPVLGSAP